MSNFDWRELMTRWSEELLESSLGESVPMDMRARGYLGFAPATDNDIAAAEARLKIALPPSYVAFLRTSNGWGPTGQAIDAIWPVQSIGWFSKRNADWIRAYVAPGDLAAEMDTREYYSYGPFASSVFKPNHLKCCLQITPVGDAAVYLLNPQAITADGEWEAWFMANWLPGVYRYRSFRELMVAQYHSFAGSDWKHDEGIFGGLPQEYVGAPGSAKRKAVVAREEPELSTDDLLAAVGRPELAMKLLPARGGSAYDSQETKSMRRLYRKLATRREERVAKALLERLQIDELSDMRQEIIDALGKLHVGGAITTAPIELLFDRLENAEDFLERHSAIGALKRLAPARLADVLVDKVRTVEFDQLPGGIYETLSELHDVRAVPLLKAMVVNSASAPDPRIGQRLAEHAVHGLVESGSEGCSALLELCQNPHAMVRKFAAVGLYYCNDNRVEAELRRLLDDSDAAVRSSVLSVIDCLRPSQRSRGAHSQHSNGRRQGRLGDLGA
jgi:hypothetical protein